MKTETVTYRCGELECEGYLARPEAPEARPGVLIAHAWMGQDDFARAKADALAELGYAGFAADLYGVGRRASTREEATALMSPLLEDRAELFRRVRASLDAMKAHDAVDASRTAAIGFCFGGLCVLDLARGGGDVRGVVSFHGLLQGTGAPPERMAARVLVLHGWDDPMAEPESVLELARELSAAGADWQLHAYGGTLHAFTNPNANDPDFGTVYDEAADRRSWQAMRGFLEEALS